MEGSAVDSMLALLIRGPSRRPRSLRVGIDEGVRDGPMFGERRKAGFEAF
jgi:hypothetical protein